MRKQSLFVKLFLSAMVLFAPIGVNAQVTIGSDNLPSQWSLLDLQNPADTDLHRALHLPRLDNDARDALVSPASLQSDQDLAEGLMIFNTETLCLEFWSGTEWISFCAGDPVDPCAGWDEMRTVFCVGDDIADLTAEARRAGGRGTIRWFATYTDDTQLPDYHLLTSGYFYADNCPEESRRAIRIYVSTTCNTNPAPGNVTAWTNVMYDFQTQELSYFVSGGGDALSWRWQVTATSADGDSWLDIPGETSPTFEIPVDFMYNVGGLASLAITKGGANLAPNSPIVVGSQIRELHFRVIRRNLTNVDVVSNILSMLFIRTNTSGFNHDDVPSLALNRISAPGTLVRMALLNEGATNDNSLGHLFQWGRRADGHQIINWRKGSRGSQENPGVVGAGYHNIFDPLTTHLNQAVRPAGTGHLNATTGQVTVASGLSSTFLRGSNNWSIDAGNLWGDGLGGSAGVRPGTGWTHSGNNPCPAGWRVPSRFEFWDVYHGNNNTPGVSAGFPTFPTFTAPNLLNSGNSWSWRPAEHGAVGGALIRNSNNEVIFLPAVGARHNHDGRLENEGTWGFYWSSTFQGPLNSFRLRFDIGGVNAADAGGIRAHGFSVRCVAE